MSRGLRCVAHRHKYVTSEEHHHLRPQSRGGLTRTDNMIWVCSNAHGDIHYFLDRIEAEARKVMAQPRLPQLAGIPIPPDDPVRAIPWSEAEHYSPKVRQLAVNGWNRYAPEFLLGRWDAHAARWSTSGDPLHPFSLPYWIIAGMGPDDMARADA